MEYQPSSAIDNPLSQLVQQIDFAENDFALFFVQIESPEKRKQWVDILRKFLDSKSIEVVTINFSEPIQDLLTPLRQSLGDQDTTKTTSILILGLENSIPADSPSLPLLSHLNLARELYKRQLRCPIIIWLPESALKVIARNAPDFWAWRSGVFDFDSATFYLETLHKELEKFDETIKALENLSGILPGGQLEDLLESFRDKQQKLLAKTYGTGIVVQGSENVVVGESSVAIHGDVKGEVYIGPKPTSRKDALNVYCRFILSRSSALALTGLDWANSDPKVQDRLELPDVYVNLDTRTVLDSESAIDLNSQREGKRQNDRPLSALEATINNRQLVLLGEPGSGKSTFLNSLARNLAAQFLDLDEITYIDEWPDKKTLPIIIALREFAQFLPDPLDNQIKLDHFWDFISRELEEQNLSNASEYIKQTLDAGNALVMFDGMDEVPHVQLKYVRDAIVSFVRRYPTNRYLVTSRTLSYSLNSSDLYLPWETFELAPLDSQKIDQFIAAWYSSLGHLGMISFESVAEMTRRLQSAIRRPDLQQLASNPLLLTVMALLNTSRGRIPETRALLYEETTDILLLRWDAAKGTDNNRVSTLRELLIKAERTDVDLKRLIWQLAFEEQSQRDRSDGNWAGDISKNKLMRSLASLKNGDYAWAKELVDTIKVRSGLLVERSSGVFSFPSRNFQEYYAGAYLTSQSDFVIRCSRLLHQDWQRWREVVLLSTERLVFLLGDTDRPLALVAELCPTEISHDELQWRNIWLAGDILLAIGTKRLQDYALGKELLKRVRLHLTELLAQEKLSPTERTLAGNTLGKLGDPRSALSPRLDSSFSPNDQILGFIEIPAGPFVMGSRNEDKESWDNEKPAHRLILSAFYIARYPVTVAQFSAFVEDSGYQPANLESLKGISNHPVVSVSWHDAQAYCQWLTHKIEKHGDLPESLSNKDWLITLPSEAEWEKVARGTDERIYPWGNGFDSTRANTHEVGIGNTSAVGTFPSGASPYGAYDMAGNVWEWTRSAWGRAFQTPDYTYPYVSDDGREDLQKSSEVYRVIRGGSFYENHLFARTTFRLSLAPNSWRATIGFRVVLRSTPASFSL